MIVEGDGPSLLGRNWLHHIRLNWSRINAIHVHNDCVSSILDKFQDVFVDELGTIQLVKAKVLVQYDIA